MGAAEGELQDEHPRQAELQPQSVDRRGDHPQVLRHQRRQAAQGVAQPPQQLRPGPGSPSGRSPRSASRRERPSRLRSRESGPVAPQVGLAPHRPQAGDPPGVVGALQLLPVVQGVPPQLAGSREVVGGDAGDGVGTTLFVELEQLGVGPDVVRIAGDEDGHVTHDADAVGPGLAARRPIELAGEEELAKAVAARGRRAARFERRRERAARGSGEAARPVPPGHAPMGPPFTAAYRA